MMIFLKPTRVSKVNFWHSQANNGSKAVLLSQNFGYQNDLGKFQTKTARPEKKWVHKTDPKIPTINQH